MSRPDELRRSLPVLRRLVGRYWPHVRQQEGLVFGSFLAIFAEVALRLLEPWPLALILDRVLGLEGKGRAIELGPLTELEPTALIAIAAGAVVVVASLRAVAAYASAVGFALAGNRLLMHVRNELYRRLQELSLSFHAQARGGDLVLRVIGDVAMVREVVVTALLPLLGNLMILIGMLSVMLWMQWELTLVALATTPLFWITSLRLGRRINRVARKQRRREGGLASRAAETLGAIQTVQALSLSERFSAEFVQEGQRSLKEGVQAKRLSARLERTVDVLNALATALVMGFGASVVLRGELSAGELVVFLTYVKSAVRPVRNFAKYTARIAKAGAAAERVLEVLEREPLVRDAPDAVCAPSLAGEVRFADATFGYGEEEPVLSHVELHLAPGDHVALVGPSGVGKSTLLAGVLRLMDPRSGRVMIDGCDLRSYTLASLRAQICVVMQESLLFAASVRENIAFGLPEGEATPEAIEAAAHLANAHEFIMALPDGYETRIGERGLDLSVGQRQRIAIARAALGQAPIVILDEPLSALDAANARSIEQALDRLCEGRTTFLVTHDLAHALRFGRIVRLEGGRLRAESAAEAGAHAVSG